MKRKIKEYEIEYTGNTFNDLFMDIKNKLEIKEDKIH